MAREEQRHELLTLSQSRERGEADRARALLLTLAGWTSPRIAEASSLALALGLIVLACAAIGVAATAVRPAERSAAVAVV